MKKSQEKQQSRNILLFWFYFSARVLLLFRRFLTNIILWVRVWTLSLLRLARISPIQEANSMQFWHVDASTSSLSPIKGMMTFNKKVLNGGTIFVEKWKWKLKWYEFLACLVTFRFQSKIVINKNNYLPWPTSKVQLHVTNNASLCFNFAV